MKNYLQFENFLNHPKVAEKNSKILEAAMKKHRLRFPQERDDEVENHRFTPFVYTFYDMVEKSGWVPFQDSFAGEYIKQHSGEFGDLYNRKKSAIDARLRRCHPSYARDLHFAMKCKESGLFDDVIYNVDLDVKQGIDLLILKDAHFYGIHCFTRTSRGQFFRNKKDNRHDDKNNFVTELDFTVYKKDGYSCGDYFLFGDRQVKALAELIQSTNIA